MSGTRRWNIALGVSSEVLGVSPGAPSDWVGVRLEDHAGVPASLREAARATAMEAQGGAAFAKTVVDVPELDATVEIVAVAAVGLRRTATDVRALLAYAMSAMERQARALDVELTVTTDPDVPHALLLDPEKIAWAATALAGNSMRYVRRGNRQMPGGSIAVSAGFDAARGELVLVVADDGPGISPEVMGRLFHRAPGAPHATGLALVVVRDIVAAHGGSMDVASSTDADDHGTTITVRIPAADQPALFHPAPGRDSGR